MRIKQLRRGKLSAFTHTELTRLLRGVSILCFVLCLSTQGGAGIYKTATGHAKPKHIGKRRPIHYAAISPDGRMGASLYGKNAIRVWNKRTGTLLRTLKHVPINDKVYHYGGVSVVKFSRTGKWLLILDDYCVGTGGAWLNYGASGVTVWNTHTGREISPPIPDFDDSTFSFTFTPDDNTLAYDCIFQYGTICTLCKINLDNEQSKMLKIFENTGDVNHGSTHFTSDGKIYKASGYGPDCAIDVATFRPHVGKR